MKKIDLSIFKVFLLGLPFVLVLALATSSIKALTENSFINGSSGLIFGAWMTLAL